MTTEHTIYKGCVIKWHDRLGGYVWDETRYGFMSEGAFPTVEDAKADTDMFFGRIPPSERDLERMWKLNVPTAA